MTEPTFSITSLRSAPIPLTRAILLYERGSCVHATVHSVTGEGGQARIGAGKPVTTRAVAELARRLSAPHERAGLLPAGLLHLTAHRMLWWRAPRPRTVYFHCDDIGSGRCSANVPHPGLVFQSDGSSLRVWAVAGRARPSMFTPLWRAPYFNVFDHGEVCAGTVRMPGTSGPDVIDLWEDAFFDSYFSHPNGTSQLAYHGGCVAFWKAMLRGRFRSFPERVLVRGSGPATLGDLIGGGNA